MTMRHLKIALLAFACSWNIAFADTDTAVSVDRVFRAGAAASNITPPLDQPIVGGWHASPATDIHDELYARCLVLDDGETKLVLVVVDCLGVSRELCDTARSMIHAKTQIPVENVLIAATHTHSSISTRGSDDDDGDYGGFIVRRIVDGVRRALNHLEPARVGWGCAKEPTQVFNRRYFMKPDTPTPNPFGGVDKAVMNPGRGNPNILKAAGPTDPEIVFLSVQSLDGRAIALLANYSLHYVGPAAGPVISADYFGVFADRIQQLLGADRMNPPFVGILSNGTSGDINNIDWLNKSGKRLAPYEKMTQVADLVAKAVHRAHEQIEFHAWVELNARCRELMLATRKPTERQIAYARNVLDKPKDAPVVHRHEQVYAKRVMSLKDSSDHTSVVLQSFRVGELGICAIPFEVFAESGLELKDKSPFKHTFTISHANGSYGYLPTARQHEWGGYETWLGTNRVEIKAAEKITDDLMAMLEQMASAGAR